MYARFYQSNHLKIIPNPIMYIIYFSQNLWILHNLQMNYLRHISHMLKKMMREMFKQNKNLLENDMICYSFFITFYFKNPFFIIFFFCSNLWLTLPKNISCFYLLIVKHNVRKPNVFRWHVQFRNTTIFIRIPTEFIVVPFLKQNKKYDTYICFREMLKCLYMRGSLNLKRKKK